MASVLSFITEEQATEFLGEYGKFHEDDLCRILAEKIVNDCPRAAEEMLKTKLSYSEDYARRYQDKTDDELVELLKILAKKCVEYDPESIRRILEGVYREHTLKPQIKSY